MPSLESKLRFLFTLRTNTATIALIIIIRSVLFFSLSFSNLQLYVKLRCEDAPMFEHTEQLLAELGGEEHGADDDEDDEAGPSVDNIEDDFIQSSDEEDDAMDH